MSDAQSCYSCDGKNELFLRRQIEEFNSLSNDALCQLLGYSYILQIQESDFEEGMSKLIQELGFRGGVLGEREVKNGD